MSNIQHALMKDIRDNQIKLLEAILGELNRIQLLMTIGRWVYCWLSRQAVKLYLLPLRWSGILASRACLLLNRGVLGSNEHNDLK